MPRVLFVGAGAPWAGGAGYLVRQNLFLGALADVAELQLAMFGCTPEQGASCPWKLTLLPLPVRREISRTKRLFDDLFSSTPRMFGGYDLRESRRAFKALGAEGFDAIFAYRIDFAHFAGVVNHRRLFLDIDDPEHLRWQRQIRTFSGSDGDWRTRRDLKKLRTWEYKAANCAKISFACQANDASAFPRSPVVVPNCVEIVANPRRADTQPRVLFVGNSTGNERSPNVDGLRFFLADIWPGIHKAIPAAIFQIVGATSPLIKEMATGIEGVELSGFVDDLREVYASAAISVAPIRFGTGTRIKILEAFAHACPVISTPAGADGIEAEPGREIELATDGPAFIEATVRLLNDAAARKRLGDGGYALAARLYDAKLQHVRLVDLLKSQLQPAV